MMGAQCGCPTVHGPTMNTWPSLRRLAMHEVFLQPLAAYPTLRWDHNFCPLGVQPECKVG